MTRSARWMLVLLALACHIVACRRAAAPAAAPPEATPEVEARIERITRDLRSSDRAAPATLGERMQKQGTPAVSIAVVDEFRLVWARGFGVKEWGGDDSIDESTVFQAASISKAVFALAVMRMLDAGRLDLDSDVNARLTAWKVLPVDGWQPKVTLRQLLSHSAATTVHGFLGYGRGEPLPNVPQILRGEAPANNATVRVLGFPGLAPRYSGGGTMIAQLLVSEVLEQPFASSMHDWLLAPLEMQHSSYAQPLLEDGPLEPAVAHTLTHEPLPGKYRVHPEAAAAGLWTTPSDLARAMLAVMHAARGEEDGPLPARWIAEMLSPQTASHMGLGFFLSGSGQSQRFGHSGANVGYRADFIGYARLGKGAIVMINSEAAPLIDEVMQAIAREYAWPDFPARAITPPPIALPLRALRKLAGSYQTAGGAVLTFRVAGSTLALEANGQPPLALVVQSATEFASPALELRVSFHAPLSGRVERVNVEQPGSPPVTATRQTGSR